MKAFQKRIEDGWSQANNNSGLTLIELIIAVFILSLIVVPLFLSFATSAKITYRSQEIGDATLVAENIAEYMVGSDFGVESVSAIVSGLDSEFQVSGTTIQTVYENYEGDADAIVSIADMTMLIGDIVGTETDPIDEFQITMENIVMETTTLDAVITLDRVSGEADAINATLLTDSSQADCIFLQSKGAGVTNDPDALSFKSFIEAAKLAGYTITNTDGSTITTYDDDTLASLTSVSADRTIEITINKYLNDSVSTEDSDGTASDVTTNTVDKWSVEISYSYVYKYTGTGTFTYEVTYDEVIEDDFEVASTEWPNIQVLFYPWYHGDEEIHIRNNNEQNPNDAGFNLYLVKQESSEINNLVSLESTYGDNIDVRLYNEKSITENIPNIYSNIETSFSGTTIITGASYYKIYQMEYFYTNASFASTESLLLESARNRYYNVTIELTIDGETDPIYELETTKLQ